MSNAITDVPGIKVGHFTDLAAGTGCTVVLCEAGAGVDVRGSAPGTRETDLLRPVNLVERIEAILLAGGSAFGLEAAGGVMLYLEEQGCGFNTGVAKVPIVPAAILFDLGIGDPKARPTAEHGYQACLAATNSPVAEGNVGAGTGATVGKALGMERAVQGGLGMASQRLEGGIVVGALAVVNAFGDVIDPDTGKTLAAPRSGEGRGFSRTIELMKAWQGRGGRFPVTNTTLGVVATNAHLTKEQVTKVAQMAQDGIARAVVPSHTMFDGDVVFALSLAQDEKISADVSALGAVAAELMALAIIRGVQAAEGLLGVPAARDLS